MATLNGPPSKRGEDYEVASDKEASLAPVTQLVGRRPLFTSLRIVLASYFHLYVNAVQIVANPGGGLRIFRGLIVDGHV